MAKRDSTQAKPVCHTRHVKIGRMFYDYKRKTMNGSQAEVPWLQLKGHWLQRAGFGIDSVVAIRVMEGCLVVTLA